MPEPTAKLYYHGGNSGLKVGHYVLPPAITRARNAADFVDMHGLHHSAKVYVTIDLTGAQLFAAGHNKPVVYEVEPVGDLEDDPDDRREGVSFTCDKAKIVAVHKVPGKLIKKAKKAMVRNMHRRPL